MPRETKKTPLPNVTSEIKEAWWRRQSPKGHLRALTWPGKVGSSGGFLEET